MMEHEDILRKAIDVFERLNLRYMIVGFFTGILKISSEEVDRDYVIQWAEKLGLMEVWTAVLRRLAKGQDGNSSGDG
ncbi:MAG: hypothetical protein SVV80_10980 [Planctomycetota bacterium]|nr:hypothetical protein [Planctomycetota bacterium]